MRNAITLRLAEMMALIAISLSLWKGIAGAEFLSLKFLTFACFFQLIAIRMTQIGGPKNG